MYNKKYRLQKIETEHKNSIHAEILGKICYLAYFNCGEKGWFHCVTHRNPLKVHTICTSEVKDVQYTRCNQVVVSTKNTKYVFEVILDGNEN